MRIEEIRKIKGLEINLETLSLKNSTEIDDRQSIKCKYFDRDCVLRIFSGVEYKKFYLNELEALKALKESGLSVQPEIYFFDDDKQILILEYFR